jgi:multiple antibiotic resistance protein
MDHFFIYVASLFSMINPLGAVPIYISLTENLSRKQKRNVIFKATLTAFITLTLFAIAGQYIFAFFGVSTGALQMVGGVVFFIMGWEMLRGKTVPKKLDHETDDEFGDDIAITPLGIPMITGPGVITMVIMYMRSAEAFSQKSIIIIAIFTACFFTAVVLFCGRYILGFLGPAISKIMMRIMGLIVMGIAFEFFFDGLKQFVDTFLAK